MPGVNLRIMAGPSDRFRARRWRLGLRSIRSRAHLARQSPRLRLYSLPRRANGSSHRLPADRPAGRVSRRARHCWSAPACWASTSPACAAGPASAASASSRSWTATSQTPTAEDAEFLTPDAIAHGFRLACRTVPFSDCRVRVPLEFADLPTADAGRGRGNGGRPRSPGEELRRHPAASLTRRPARGCGQACRCPARAAWSDGITRRPRGPARDLPKPALPRRLAGRLLASPGRDPRGRSHHAPSA